jgi:small subunit ribosomal protein S3
VGQKSHPYIFRIGIVNTWRSQWFGRKKDYATWLYEDFKIREFVKKQYSSASISQTIIKRASGKVRIEIHTAKPGIIIGRKGADIDRLREELQRITKNKEVLIDVKEIKNPAIDAQLVAENVAFQLMKRIAFRRAMKKAVSQTMAAGGGGIKIICSGRLGGAEMARREKYLEGKVPLHTLRAIIDYGFAEAKTTYGLIGVKVWIYRGEVLPQKHASAPVVSISHQEAKCLY